MGERVKHLAIIGGGAAGLAAAIAAGEQARRLETRLDVAVYERDDRVGRSILATGNGRCNFSNAHPYANDYHNADFVEEAFCGLRYAYSAATEGRDAKIIRDCGHEVNAFFYKHGLLWREEDDGRQYPLTNKASTVVDLLRSAAQRVGVHERCEREVAAIDPPQTAGLPFTLRFSDKRLERADAIVVACGGRAVTALDTFGLPRVVSKPTLGPLKCSETGITRELDNIRVRCEVSLERTSHGQPKTVARERGELMFRKYGVSGICVFNLSRFAEPGDILSVNFLDGNNVAGAKDFLFRRRRLLAQTLGDKLTCEDMMRGLLLPRVYDVVLKRCGLRGDKPFTKADVSELAAALVSFTLTVQGVGDESICQVRRGGLDVRTFDPRTLEAREVPGLYAVGEALDVDGPCGGYNLHWAWSSGILAGLSACGKLCDS